MRIVTKKEFLCLPSYTLYARIGIDTAHLDTAHLNLSELSLSVKHETESNGNDWVYSPLIAFDSDGPEYFDILEKIKTGHSVEIDCEMTSRDGKYEEEECFLVFSQEDCQKILAVVLECILGHHTPSSHF